MAFFSLEMTDVQLANRLMANHGGAPTDGGEIRNSSINGGNLPPDGFDNIDLKSIIPPPDGKPASF